MQQIFNAELYISEKLSAVKIRRQNLPALVRNLTSSSPRFVFSRLGGADQKTYDYEVRIYSSNMKGRSGRVSLKIVVDSNERAILRTRLASEDRGEYPNSGKHLPVG